MQARAYGPETSSTCPAHFFRWCITPSFALVLHASLPSFASISATAVCGAEPTKTDRNGPTQNETDKSSPAQVFIAQSRLWRCKSLMCSTAVALIICHRSLQLWQPYSILSLYTPRHTVRPVPFSALCSIN